MVQTLLSAAPRCGRAPQSVANCPTMRTINQYIVSPFHMAFERLMRTQLRIVAGDLRGRKLLCTVNAFVRPTPQRVREALFSILGDAVPDRHFVDVFAGTGVVGLEALSRGAKHAFF